MVAHRAGAIGMIASCERLSALARGERRMEWPVLLSGRTIVVYRGRVGRREAGAEADLVGG